MGPASLISISLSSIAKGNNTNITKKMFPGMSIVWALVNAFCYSFLQEPWLPKGNSAQEHVSDLHSELYDYHHPPGWSSTQWRAREKGPGKHCMICFWFILKDIVHIKSEHGAIIWLKQLFIYVITFTFTIEFCIKRGISFLYSYWRLLLYGVVKGWE